MSEHHEKFFKTEWLQLSQRFVKGEESPSKSFETITADSVALVSLLWEEGLPLKVYFHRRKEKKFRDWLWLDWVFIISK